MAACAAAVTVVVIAPTTARAYSNFNDYTRAIEEGGGGGHLFSGSPGDGHTCEVCHRGAEGTALEVTGLPKDGYVPGQSYEIGLRWPQAPHVAVMTELTDTAGAPAGVTALPPYAGWEPDELCEDGAFPAADVCKLDAAGSGCCRDLDPTRDACSFPGERGVHWVLDCGSRYARLVWTAPDAGAGDVWFSSAMVTSDVGFDILGDGVTSVRMRIRPAGTPPELTVAAGDCTAAPGMRTEASGLGTALMLGLLGVRLRRFRRGSARGHQYRR